MPYNSSTRTVSDATTAATAAVAADKDLMQTCEVQLVASVLLQKASQQLPM
jgi:hypothetical protein